MYPFVRVLAAMHRAGRQPRLDPGEVHIVRTRCWPWDIDPFGELNNGRSLTLMDIGRTSLLRRSGLIERLHARGRRITMAGSVVQYRRRVPPFADMEIRSRMLGTDARFFYIEHVTWTKGAPAHHAVYRAVAVGPEGIVPTAEALDGDDRPGWRAPLPDWVAAWSEAERLRPWPPGL